MFSGKVTRPTALLDENRVKSNIKRMFDKAQKAGVIFRPHFKTHQSIAVGEWFRELDVSKITTSSLLMAKYFADAGWNDITVAFPVNVCEINLINELAAKIKLNLLVESVDSVNYLKEKVTSNIGIYIKADIGYHRAGVDPHNFQLIDSIIEAIKSAAKLSFDGFIGHAGHAYHAITDDNLNKIHTDSLACLESLESHYRKVYPNMILSTGDTPTCSRKDNFAPANELRPGNFVFYDLEQHSINSCPEEQVAIAVLCPVVSVHPERNEIIIYGGGVHFSKERLGTDGWPQCYGMLINYSESGFGKIEHAIYLKSLSQEHGIVHAPSELINKFKVGDLLAFVPIHSCMTADCLRSYITFDGKKLDHFSYDSFA